MYRHHRLALALRGPRERLTPEQIGLIERYTDVLYLMGASLFLVTAIIPFIFPGIVPPYQTSWDADDHDVAIAEEASPARDSGEGVEA